MGWLYAVGLAGSSSVSGSPSEIPTAPFVTLNGKPQQRQLSWRGWRTRRWIRRLSGTISQPSTAARGVEQWILSLAASPASHSASPAIVEESRTSAGSGLTLQGSLLNPSLNTCSWRTCRASWATDCASCGLIYDAWVSEFEQATSARQRSVRRIADNDSSLWPSDGEPGAGARYPTIVGAWTTQTAMDSRASGSADYPTDSGRHSGVTLTDQARSWPSSANENRTTKHAPSHGKSHGKTAGGMAMEWPTPDASVRTGSNQGGAAGRVGRIRPTLAELGRPALNPRFVEWLMGLPIGWTASEPLGTEWCLWLRRMRSELSGG